MSETHSVDVDSRPDVAVEMDCHVEVAESGEPRLLPLHRARWRAVLTRLKDRTVLVRIIRTKKRSNPQNAYLWGVVYVDVMEGLRALAEEAGEAPVFATDEDLHDAMKWKFLRHQDVLPGGEIVERPGRSSRLTMEQFSEFVSRIIAWAAGYGITVRSSEAA